MEWSITEDPSEAADKAEALMARAREAIDQKEFPDGLRDSVAEAARFMDAMARRSESSDEEASERCRKASEALGKLAEKIPGRSGSRPRAKKPARRVNTEQVSAEEKKRLEDRIAQVLSVMPVEGKTLDRQQVEAIARDGHTRLVIAGAGTGKTTTIVGFVKDLILNRKEDPSKILLLSFTNAAVDELRKRVYDETGRTVEARTFHSLGLSILRKTDGDGVRPADVDMRDFVRRRLADLTKDADYRHALVRYMSYDPAGGRRGRGLETLGDVMDYFDRDPSRTLRGERAICFGEKAIADFLFVNGVDYEMDADYVCDTVRDYGRQYRPEFRIPGTEVCIEYFCLDGRGGVDPEFREFWHGSCEAYEREVAFRRDVNYGYGTDLVEIKTCDIGRDVLGSLERTLGRDLRGLGIGLHPMSPDDLFFELDSMRIINAAATQLTGSLALIRNSGRDIDDVFRGLSGSRLALLKRLLAPIYREYMDELMVSGGRDFADMLNTSAKRAGSGDYVCPYETVVVDEYQDLAGPSYRLLRAMREKVPFELFCVGDDWQSIYRFNGSDVGYIMDFRKHWRDAEVCRIERTYRFSGRLLEASGRFIMRNPRQVRKDLRGPEGRDTFLAALWAESRDDEPFEVWNVIDGLPEGSSVLLLGRYSFDRDLIDHEKFSVSGGSGTAAKVSCEDRPDLDIRFMTVHGAKGLEADYVFVLNTRSGRMGFPNMLEDSPLADVLLEAKESYPFAEERRLFYVAMTRARKGTFLVLVRNDVGYFAREIVDDVYPIGDRNRVCPKCGCMLNEIPSKYGGSFWGCSAYRRTGCDYTEDLRRR